MDAAPKRKEDKYTKVPAEFQEAGHLTVPCPVEADCRQTVPNMEELARCKVVFCHCPEGTRDNIHYKQGPFQILALQQLI